jgi:hypothetical protein
MPKHTDRGVIELLKKINDEINNMLYDIICIMFCCRKYITLIISCVYAIVLVTMGFMVYIASAILSSDIAIVSIIFIKRKHMHIMYKM